MKGRVIISRPGDPDPMIIKAGTKVILTELENVVILEKGTVNGKTSVNMHAMVNGDNVFMQITGEVFQNIAAALTGADMFFKENPLGEVEEKVSACPHDTKNKGVCKECKHLPGGCPAKKK